MNENAEVYEMELWHFEQCEDPSKESYFAVRAIESHIEAGVPIPDTLIPWVNKALQALAKSQGKEHKKAVEADIRGARIQEVRLLMYDGLTKEAAIEAVAKKYNRSFNTIEKEYKTYKEDRKTIEMLHGMDTWCKRLFI